MYCERDRYGRPYQPRRLELTCIACIAGASIICVDVLVRCIPSKRNFRIENSGAFLASSMSLSFGVMVRTPPCYAIADANVADFLRVIQHPSLLEEIPHTKWIFSFESGLDTVGGVRGGLLWNTDCLAVCTPLYALPRSKLRPHT